MKPFSLEEVKRMVEKVKENPNRLVGVSTFRSNGCNYEFRVYSNGMFLIDNLDPFPVHQSSFEEREKFRIIMKKFSDRVKKIQPCINVHL